MRNKKVIVSLIIILLIISIILAIMLNNSKREANEERKQYENITEKGSITSDYYGKTERNGIEREAFFDINTCIKIYLDAINKNNSTYFEENTNGEYIKVVDDSYIKNRIYNLLSQKYISQNGVDTNNVFNKVKMLDKQAVYIPLEASVIKDDKITSFVVHGIIEDAIENNLLDEVFFVVNIDVNNNLFSIEPIYGKYNSISEIKIDRTIDSLEKNGDNKFRRATVDYVTDTSNYINMYKRLTLGAPEIMYNLLDEEYRNARFGSLTNFEAYVDKNRKEISQIKADSYLVNTYDNYTEYVIKDQYGNLYIFDQKAVLDYTVKLDTYTLKQEKFDSTYKTATNKQKVMMNIDKFFQMINANDYTTSYKLLNNNFKALNFKTEESFENYMRQNIFTHADVTYVKFSDEISGVFTYYIELTDKTKSSDKKIKMNVVMQLLEGTDYQLSFEILK